MTIPARNWAGRTLGLLLLFVAFSGCRQQPVEIPRSGASAAIGDGTVIFVRWKDGPAVMICSDFNPRSDKPPVQTSGQSGNATAPLIAKEEGFQCSGDGRRFDWSMETEDGRSVKCRLDAKEYDLANGTLFLVKTKGGKTEVEQVTKDLSAVQPDATSFEEFARKDAAVSKFLGFKAD